MTDTFYSYLFLYREEEVFGGGVFLCKAFMKDVLRYKDINTLEIFVVIGNLSSVVNDFLFFSI